MEEGDEDVGEDDGGVGVDHRHTMMASAVFRRHQGLCSQDRCLPRRPHSGEVLPPSPGTAPRIACRLYHRPHRCGPCFTLNRKKVWSKSWLLSRNKISSFTVCRHRGILKAKLLSFRVCRRRGTLKA